MGDREAAIADRAAMRMCILARIVPECLPDPVEAAFDPGCRVRKNRLPRLAFGEFFTYTQTRLQIIECTRRSLPVRSESSLDYLQVDTSSFLLLSR